MSVTVIENMTANGQPMFGPETREYLHRVREVLEVSPPPGVIAKMRALLDVTRVSPWFTETCPECDEAVTGDGFVPTADGIAAHVVLGGSVVLGCEGYFVISPAALGMDPSQWQDWRDDV